MTETWTVQRMLAWMAQDFAALGVATPAAAMPSGTR